MTLKNNRAPLPSVIKLYASFHHHMWIQTGVTAQKRLSWVVTSVTLTFDLWPRPFAWTSLLSLVITPENFMMIRWWKHSQQGVQRTTTPLSPKISERIALLWANRLETARVSHWPITWPIYLPCTVTQEQAHHESDIVSNSHLFYSKSINLPIPKIWLLKIWPWKSKVKVMVRSKF